ncbi:MAG: hypothetical protein ACXVQR_02100 [Solirubrobacteraceae bacterium]
MSQHAQDLHPVRIRIQRPSLAWLFGLVLAVAIVATSTILIVNDSSVNSQTSRAVQTSIGGPNEASRGASVAAASGVASPLPTGGVDETARGSSVAAATSLPTTGGVNETARGQSAASASR